ncbi:MAG: SPOR domain-containing protein [Bacteroides sp.]|jgi:nucleoid DNA-binding protein|nr:SPOR domain-containing protein [Bacteroides sp.]
MKIGTYISELLFDQEYVLLPGFGEFSTKYIPARFIPEEKKIESPKKVITFNAEKKEGETPLIAHIAGKELKDLNEVKDYVDNFVREIKETLSSGQKVQLDRLGIFSNDADGNLSFDPDLGINYLADTAGLDTISEPPKATVPPVVTPVVVPEEIPEAEAPAEAAPEEAEPEEVKEEPIAEPVAKPVEEPVSREEEPAAAYPASPEPVRQDLPKAVKWLAWVIIPFLVVIIILAFNWNFIFGKRSKAPAPKAQTEQAAPAAVSETDTETPAAEEVTPEETPAAAQPTAAPAAAQAPAKPTPGQKTYFIVVGAFQDEAQANQLVNELQGKGASQAQIFMTTNTGYHRVCYAFFTDLTQAETLLPRVQQEVNPNAWILHRN